MRKIILLIILFTSGCTQVKHQPAIPKETVKDPNITNQWTADTSTIPTTLEENEQMHIWMKRKIDSTYTADSLREITYIKEHPPSKYEASMYARMRSITSYSQFARNYFMLGSSMDEVRNVQELPGDVVKLGQYSETWFYGNCEITFYNNRVDKVLNASNCINYIDSKVCLLAPERRVRAAMKMVIEERVKMEHPDFRQ
jgi:hypothetical protein